jgi:hypothetical protein
MSAPMVSVVVPNYNHAPFLRRRLETILAQTYQDFELILLDDASTDDSRAILSEYGSDPRARLDFNEVNSGGVYKQWNKGVRLARGKYVWLAESDDYADPRLLERLVAALESDSRIVVAYCRSWRVVEGGRLDGFVYWGNEEQNPRWHSDFRVDGREECRNYFPLYNPIRNASSAVFRKEAYEHAGGADEEFRVAGDWKLWAAMALTGDMAYVGEPLNYQQFHAANTQRTAGETVIIEEILRVLRWLLDGIEPSETVMERSRDWLAGHWVPLVMSARVSMEQKRALIHGVRAIDPHPLRRIARPLATTVRLKLRRHWRGLRSEPAPAARA